MHWIYTLALTIYHDSWRLYDQINQALRSEIHNNSELWEIARLRLNRDPFVTFSGFEPRRHCSCRKKQWLRFVWRKCSEIENSRFHGDCRFLLHNPGIEDHCQCSRIVWKNRFYVGIGCMRCYSVPLTTESLPLLTKKSENGVDKT